LATFAAIFGLAREQFSNGKLIFRHLAKKYYLAQSLCISISRLDAMRISAPNNFKCGVNTRFQMQFRVNSELQRMSKNTTQNCLIL